MIKRRNLRTVLMTGALLSAGAAEAADRAPPAKETRVLERIEAPGDHRQMGMGIAEFPPNAEKPRHMANGPEVAYVLEGQVTVIVDGQPPRVVHAGESYQMGANVAHITRAGPAGAKVLATWILIPGQPFNTVLPN